MALNYTSVNALLALLSESQMAQITDDSDEGTLSTDEEMVEQVLEYAESTVDTYIQSRYETPLDPVPPAVKYAALVVGKYRLMLRREYMSPEIEQEYREVMDWLRAVQEDRADLYTRAEDGSDSEITSGTSVNTTFGPDWFVRYGYATPLITGR